MTRAWSVTDIRSMEGEREQFAHVVKHLYRPAEHWEQVVPELAESRGKALGAESPTFFPSKGPDWSAVPDAYRRCVLSDHDRLYAPAYREALCDAEAAGRFGQLESNGPGPGWAFVDSRGVYVIVGERKMQAPKVRTAYRVLPPHASSRRTEDFFKAAVRRLRDKSSYPERGS